MKKGCIMGMGFAANHVVTISDENLQRLCPVEYAAFMEIFENPYITRQMVYWFLELGIPLKDSYCGEEEINGTMWDALETTVQTLWDSLCNAFWERTKVGDSVLSLYYGYHDSDEGDRHDDVQGQYWGVENVRIYTPAAEAIKDVLEDAFFVTFG